MADLIRSFGYDDDTGLPVMIIRKNTPTLKTYRFGARVPVSYCIKLNDAWMYSEKHNRHGSMGFDEDGILKPIPNFMQIMMKTCIDIHQLFNLGSIEKRQKQKFKKIASFVEDGLDELVKMPPQPKKLVTVGEYEMITEARNEKGEIEGKTVIKQPLIVKEPLL